MQLLVKDLSINKAITNEWIKQNCYIAGGACVSNATRQPIHDVDIYFKTKEARDFFIEKTTEKYIAKNSKEWCALMMYDDLFKNNKVAQGDDETFDDLGFKISSDKFEGIVYYELYAIKDGEHYDHIASVPQPLFEKQKWMFNNGYDFVLLDKNHYAVDSKEFHGNKSITFKKNEMVYQFILRFYGEPSEMMDETFDYQHCKIAYDLAMKEYIASKETWMALSKRELIYVNSFYPISSLKRMYKYGNRGYKWNNDVFVKIIRDIHKVDADNKFVMEDQLIGYYEDFDYNDVFCDADDFYKLCEVIVDET